MEDIESKVEMLRFNEEYIQFLSIKKWKGGSTLELVKEESEIREATQVLKENKHQDHDQVSDMERK